MIVQLGACYDPQPDNHDGDLVIFVRDETQGADFSAIPLTKLRHAAYRE